ncbi:LacI family transcriptional regulator [Paenibacillus doosanensis]|uniref:HTH-type transcriptional repressor ExuR n=1 Tax=Paenibacillus konkukensis TaxID=2020716 RepID=A0ABY4RKN7_9BACL|nr:MULTISPECIES: LacI family DNA-binding transcriptional regulator [Paenibacillus]MCS7462901.1 LacI family transcriptional regulator [Paenibacillus doosanensis]UQZ82405.1 putative HTH-type transcriptional repressor ExuR [Paenibacillus konkukensis]
MKKIELNSKEIAEIAGVSRSTVSRVINNYANVPQKTREKVMKVIEQYGYTPNISARTLAGKKTKTIGLFFIDQWQFSKDSSANMLITSVIENASAFGYIVLTSVVRDLKHPDSVKNVKDVFYQGSITAGIFIGAENHEPVIEELIAEGFIIGVLDQVLPGRNEPNRIVYNLNNEQVARQAVDYLMKLNHKRIGIINGDLKKASANFKFKGFVSQMEHHGLEINKAWIMYGHYEAGGYEAMSNLLANSSDLPTAIFASSDSIAFGAIRAINDRALKVPDDISVIGMNDQALSAYYKPALTTFRVNYDQLTAGVTQSVIRAIENGTAEQCVIATLDCVLVERESCKKL